MNQPPAPPPPPQDPREVALRQARLEQQAMEAKLDILMLVGVEDVDVVALDQEVDDGGDDSLAVGAVDEQDGDLWIRIGHGFQGERCG